MNKNYTLKELAEIHQRAWSVAQRSYSEEEKADELAIEAVLDAVGYELPKDEEREAFERWKDTKKDVAASSDPFFDVWKAGREELRRATAIPVCAVNPDAKPKEPAWIPWKGGECPLPDTVKRWEYRARHGTTFVTEHRPCGYRWWHADRDEFSDHDIVAYRVLEG